MPRPPSFVLQTTLFADLEEPLGITVGVREVRITLRILDQGRLALGTVRVAADRVPADILRVHAGHIGIRPDHDLRLVERLHSASPFSHMKGSETR